MQKYCALERFCTRATFSGNDLWYHRLFFHKVDVLNTVNLDWENKLKESLQKSTEESALRMKLEHEVRTHASNVFLLALPFFHPCSIGRHSCMPGKMNTFVMWWRS